MRERFKAFETRLAQAVLTKQIQITLAELNSWSYANDRQILTAEWIQANPA
ncbi:hypothetical protein ROSA5918_21665 [Roseateles saccharophilus]|uniref:Uncharacterized protein n=1 Tax=Roseateles saccharophilus TaxID=304 RepID=A0A4R3UAG2_ROSSA|nr:hypothetical protein EV671_105618 [Roseateles saccharophilus]